MSEATAIAEGESSFTYSVHVYDPDWLHGRREIESFFIGEVDRDKLVLAGSALEGGEAEQGLSALARQAKEAREKGDYEAPPPSAADAAHYVEGAADFIAAVEKLLDGGREPKA
ncbi:MAG TPA: hypothetical protein VHU14_07495 [Solirubrobacterales bacterium]|nr:hypothetical protein [Solirubrobacterales bacterium]